MSSIEGPMCLKQDGDFRLMDVSRTLYWQGFWQDNTEPSLELYLKYFSPRFAHLLVKHRSLRLALRFYRRFNPWFLITTLTLQVFYLFPKAMYLYSSDPRDLVGNFFATIIHGLQLMTATAAYFQTTRMKSIFSEMDSMLVPGQLDNQEQREIYYNTRKFCNQIINNIRIPVFAAVCIFGTFDYCYRALPGRVFQFAEWYPWDTSASPAFEITLFVRWLQTISYIIMSSAILPTLPLAMIMPQSNFKILNNKLEKVRLISTERIKARKMAKSGDGSVAADTILTIDEFDNGDVVPMSGLALRGGQLRAGPAVFSTGRVDNLALVSTLYEAGDAGSSSRRDGMPLGSALRADQLGAAPAALSASRVDNLALVSTLYEAGNAGSSSRRNGMPLGGALQIGPAAFSAGRVDTVESVSPLYEADDGSTSVREGMPVEDVFQDCNDIQPENESECTTAELDKEMQNTLTEAIQLHVSLIRYIGLGEIFTNGPLVVLLIANTLVLAVAALAANTTDTSNMLLVLVTVFVCTWIMLMYLIVNNAIQMVSDQHEAVCVSMYNSDWIEASPSFKKSMLVVMSRANVPLEVKPTGLDPLSRKNFAQVMNIAYKMVNTLSTMTK